MTEKMNNIRLTGVAASPGIVFGPVRVLAGDTAEVRKKHVSKARVPKEIEKFTQALNAATDDLGQLFEKTALAYGVEAAQIGTERGPRTEIHCGIDFKVEQKLIWIRDRNIALAFKLREIENRMKANPSTQNVLSPLRGRIKAAIHQLNENARALVTNLDRNEDGTCRSGKWCTPARTSRSAMSPISSPG